MVGEGRVFLPGRSISVAALWPTCLEGQTEEVKLPWRYRRRLVACCKNRWTPVRAQPDPLQPDPVLYTVIVLYALENQKKKKNKNSVRHYISILCILYIQGLINKAWTVSHSFYLKHRCRYDKRQKKETSQRQTSEERNVATTNVGRKKRRKDKRRKKKKPEKQTMENCDPWTTNVKHWYPIMTKVETPQP